METGRRLLLVLRKSGDVGIPLGKCQSLQYPSEMARNPSSIPEPSMSFRTSYIAQSYHHEELRAPSFHRS